MIAASSLGSSTRLVRSLVPGVVFTVLLACAGLPETALAQQQAGGQGVPVTVVSAARRDFPLLLRNIGTVQAFKSVLVRNRVDGTLDHVLFTEGQEVQRGDVLAQLDPRPYQAALDQAMAKKASDEATLANAKIDLNRYTQLARSQFASMQQVDSQTALVAQLTASLRGDDATIETARLNLDFARITAPISGKVGLRLVDEGNFLRAADTTNPGIVTITQVHPISVVFSVPQARLGAVRAAMAGGKLPVVAYTQDDRTKLADGELLTTDNAIDASTGTIRMKATFPNTDDALWPGQFVNTRMQTGTLAHVLTVPSVAVQRGAEGLYVFLLKPDSTVSVQPVTIDQDDGQVAVVSKGLDDGAAVVVNGQSRLQNGTRVAATALKPTT
jgi:membrane fusion protein, multidrug efflux system